MTAQDLTALADKLDELAMKATPGPWLPPEVIPPMGREAGWVLLRFNGEGYAWTDMPKQLTFNSEPRSRDEYLQDVADAELLIALRNALPQITTALREAARMRGVASNADRAMRFVKLVASQRLSEQAIAWYGGEFGEDGEPDFEGAYDSFIEQARSIWSDIERAALESPRGA